jgi:hypothetical protein
MRLILIGGLFLFGGLSGGMVLRGTGSSGALALVGLVMMVIGFISLSKGGNSGDGFEATPSEADRERDAEQWAVYQRVRAEQAAAAAQAEQEAEAQAEGAYDDEDYDDEAQEDEQELDLPADDPRRQRLEALLLMTPGAREQIEDLLQRTSGHLSEDEQLNVALDTARRLHQARAAQA